MKLKFGMIAACSLALLVSAAFSQDAKNEPRPRFKVTLVLKQLDHDKVVSTHSFTMSVEASGDRGASQIRSGDRLPVTVDSTGKDKAFQYIDVGFSCDARIEHMISANAAAMEFTWDLSMVPGSTAQAGMGDPAPIRQVRVKSTPLVPVGKSTLVGSADDVSSGNQYELYVTLTPEA